MKHLLLLISFLLFAAIPVDAQSIYDIDMKLAGYLQKVNYWEDYDYHDRNSVTKDSLDKANNNLYNYLINICEKKPAVIHAELPKAEQNGLSVVSSIDHKLRLYSWDSRMGGSTRYYENIAQYQAADGVRVLDMKDSTAAIDHGSEYRSIATIYTWSQQVIYLVRDYRITTNRRRRESITAYTIEDGALKKVDLFRSKAGQTNTIGYEYDALISDRRFTFKDMPVIHLSADRQLLFLPIVAAGDEISGRYMVYMFNGKNFVYRSNMK